MKKLYFNASRNADDPEKSILPSLIFINANHPSFAGIKRKGFMLCIGWWDFSVKFGIFF
jgi:hypothetical protein